MAIDQLDVVNFIGHDEADGEIVLGIADHPPPDG